MDEFDLWFRRAIVVGADGLGGAIAAGPRRAANRCRDRRRD
jgi:hypothetical protein